MANIFISPCASVQAVDQCPKDCTIIPTTKGNINSNPPRGTPVKAPLNNPKEHYIIENFQLSMFGPTLSWGGIALCIAGLPELSPSFHNVAQWIGTVMWLWNMCYWLIFTYLFIARCIMFPKGTLKMTRHPLQFVFIAAWPAGLEPISVGFVVFGTKVGLSSSTSTEITYVLFWFAAVVSLLVAYIPVYFMITRQSHSLKGVNALWLYPFIACIYTAVTGGILTKVLDQDRVMPVMFMCLILLGLSLPMCAIILALFTARLFFYGVPPNIIGNSTWMVMGFLGQGANSSLILGQSIGVLSTTGSLLCPSPLEATNGSVNIAGAHPLCSFGQLAPGASIFLGVSLWALTNWWTILSIHLSIRNARIFKKVVRAACCSLRRSNKKGKEPKETDPLDNPGLPFNIGWSATIFFCTHVFSSYQLYYATGLRFFLIMSYIFCPFIVLLACYVHYSALQHAYDGRLWVTFRN